MADYTKKELLQELARRRGLDASGQGASAAAPQSAAQFIEAVGAQRPASGVEQARSVLRGATGGLSDVVGAGVAALPIAMSQLQPGYQGPTVGEAYQDIQADIAQQGSEAGAGLEGLGATLAAPALLSGAGGGRVLGRALGRRGAASRASSAAAKPRVRAVAGVAAPKAAKRSAKEVAEDAAVGAVAGEVLADDPLMGVMINTPLGRLLTSRAAGKLLGERVKPLVYTGSHPATRRWISSHMDRLSKFLRRSK